MSPVARVYAMIRPGLMICALCAALHGSELPGEALFWASGSDVPRHRTDPPLPVDIDGDGLADSILWQRSGSNPRQPWQLVLTNDQGQRPVLLASGDAWLTPPGLLDAPRCIPRDLDGDGRVDLILAYDLRQALHDDKKPYPGYRHPAKWTPHSGRMAAIYNRGEAGQAIFTSLRDLPMRGDEPLWQHQPWPLLLDLDGDERKDLLIADGDAGLRVLLHVGLPTQATFLDAGLLDDQRGWPLAGRELRRLAFIDGRAAAADSAGCHWRHLEQASLLSRQLGSVILQRLDERRPIVGPYSACDLADLDGDQHPELLLGLRDGSLQVCIQAGSDWLAPAPLQLRLGKHVLQACEQYGDGSPRGPIDWGYDQPRPRVCDWDGDNIPDLLVGGLGRRILFYRGQRLEGAQRFEPGQVLRLPGGPLQVPLQQVAVEDLDGDSHADLIAVDQDGGIRCWLGQGGIELSPGEPLRDTAGKTLLAAPGACLIIAAVNGGRSRDLFVAEPGRGLRRHAKRALGRFAAAQMILGDDATIEALAIDGARMLLSMRRDGGDSHLLTIDIAAL